MINVYINNKERNLLGFTFYLFDNSQFVMDYDKYDNYSDLERYLKESKGDILGINMEKYVRFCEENAGENITILIKESVSDLKKALSWRAKHRDKYNEFINLAKRGESKLKELVNSQSGENKKKALMMYCMIMDFINNESDVINNI